jgi:hypothetical protein
MPKKLISISLTDMDKLLEAGIASNLPKEEVWEEEWNDNYHFYEKKWLLSVVSKVQIGNCTFSTTSWQDGLPADKSYVGFANQHVLKNLRKFGINPELEENKYDALFTLSMQLLWRHSN